MFMHVALQSKLSSADKVFQRKENKMRISQNILQHEIFIFIHLLTQESGLHGC